MIELLLDLPVLFKVMGTLVFILILNRLSKSMIISIGLGTLLLAFWSGHSMYSMADIAWRRFSSRDNIMLIAIVLLVIWLSTLMSKTGVMKDLVNVIQVRMPHRLAFAALPAVIGLLPMPGGAIFSAPLVERYDHKGRLSGLLKTQINYWFRHIWEYWWPLYPAVLLALELTGLEVWQFILLQMPVTILAFGSGYWFLLRRIPREDERSAAPPVSVKPFWVLVLPILTIIASYACIQIILPAVVRVSKYLPMMIGLFLALFILQVQRKAALSVWKELLFSKRAYSLALLIALVRVYGAFIEAPLTGGILMVEQMRLDLVQVGIPLLAVMMLIPFLSGLAMGLFVGVVGASFPIVLSLLGPDPSTGVLLSATLLSYGCGFMGVMLSPVHVCLVVSSDYFKTRLLTCLINLAGPVCLVLLGVIALSLGVEWLCAW